MAPCPVLNLLPKNQIKIQILPCLIDPFCNLLRHADQEGKHALDLQVPILTRILTKRQQPKSFTALRPYP